MENKHTGTTTTSVGPNSIIHTMIESIFGIVYFAKIIDDNIKVFIHTHTVMVIIRILSSPKEAFFCFFFLTDLFLVRFFCVISNHLVFIYVNYDDIDKIKIKICTLKTKRILSLKILKSNRHISIRIESVNRKCYHQTKKSRCFLIGHFFVANVSRKTKKKPRHHKIIFTLCFLNI